MSKKYIIVQWPESQELMEEDGFREHCCLINDSMEDDPKSFLARYGSSAFFVEEKWYNDNKSTFDMNDDLMLEEL